MANNKTRWEQDSPPNILLAIDPGASFPKSKVPYAGAALFQWGELVWGALVKAPDKCSLFGQPNGLVKRVYQEAGIPRRLKDLGEPLTALVVEKPRIYKRGAARPDDIVALSVIYGAFMGGIDAEFYSGPGPSEWKGSIDGVILHERAVRILNTSERSVLMNAQRSGDGGLSEHTIDAAALGLYTLGRCSKACVV